MIQTSLFRTAGFHYAAWSALVFGLSAMILGVFVYYSVRENMEQQLQDNITAETAQLLGDYGDQGIEELRHDIRERIERNPTPRLFYTLENAEGDTVFDRLPLASKDGWSKLALSGRSDRLMLTTTLDDGFRLGVAADTRSIVQLGQGLRQTILIALAGMLLLSVLSGLLVSWRFLNRVDQFKRTAEKVGAGALTERIPLDEVGDDFDQLALAINRMLDRIEQLMNDVRYVSVGIAHDLRTPLGTLRQRLERLATLQATDEAREASEEALKVLDETMKTFSALLTIGELDSGSATLGFESIDLSALFETLMDAYGPIAEERQVRLDCEVQGQVRMTGDRQLIMQLFTNLLDNAFSHNDGRFSLSLQTYQTDTGIEVVVADTGKGVPRSAFTEVLKPFHRLDASRHTPGTGLGLSLAASIAARHGARMVLEDNAPGLRVTVSFLTQLGGRAH
ncbi:HAMP domain-containing sensor histidine kinase [Allohahella marinimesophila]|uniref:histidine kinase n=1 Tax=Allohahella marinimesophila TaxID=1054972 RepID=A0ABP7NJD4_9GAMM